MSSAFEKTPLKQRSVEWRRMRLGSVTASRFGDVLTEPRSKLARTAGEWSETAKSYLLEKLAELLTGVPCERFQNSAMRWGVEWEDEARRMAAEEIQRELGQDVQLPEGEFAFIQHPTEPYVGCSPDGIVGSDALLELKCPYNPAVHLRTVLAGEMPREHTPQVQGSLWITGRSRYVFASFDPRLRGVANPLWMTVVERDDEYIAGMAKRILAFRDWVLREYEKIAGKPPF